MALSVHGLHPDLRARAEWCLKVASQAGIPVTVTSVKRTWANQVKLYENFQQCRRRGLYPSAASLSPGMSCKYPANPPGESAHEFGLAWDSWVPATHQDDWDAIRRYAGFRVPENDRIHAELPNWRDIPPALLVSLRQS